MTGAPEYAAAQNPACGVAIEISAVGAQQAGTHP